MGTVADDSIDTVHIVDDAVTTDKLANSINTDIATGVTANATANAALPKTGGAMTGAITTNSTFDGRDVSADGAKLDGIAAGANNYTLPAATVTVVGGVELATNAETTAGTDTARAVTPAGAKAALDLKANLASPTFTGTVAIPNIANLETAVAANTAKVTNVSTDLSVTANGDSLTINSSDGNNASLPAATASAWGVMSDEQASKLAGIESGATADQSAGEILTLLEDGIDSVHYKDLSIDIVHIANTTIAYAKIQNVSATDRILGRDSAGAGVVEEISPAALRTMINVEDGATADQTQADINGLAITTVGTISTGTWEGTTIAVAQGGTGATTLNNLITLGTHTTGNYVATIADAGDGAITVANSGSETAAVTLDIADNAVGMEELAGIARGKIIVGDASGNPALLAAGAENQVLTIDANGDAVWAAASGGGGTPTAITVADTDDTSSFVALFESDTGDLEPKTDADITYNADTGELSTKKLSTGLLTTQVTTDSASVQQGIFKGGNRGTALAGDESYISYQLENSAGNQVEFARMTWQADDVTHGSKDAELRFEVVGYDGTDDALKYGLVIGHSPDRSGSDGSGGTATTTIDTSGGINASVTSFDVASFSNINVGDLILVGAEYMLVLAKSGTKTIQVTREVEHTSAASHSDGAAVTILNKKRTVWVGERQSQLVNRQVFSSYRNYTETSGSQAALSFQIRADNTSTSTAQTKGVQGQAGTKSGSATNNGSVVGLEGQVFHRSSNSLATGIGVNVSMNNNGGGTITNMYGLYIASMNTGTVTNSYGIYQAHANDDNFFAGKVGIGITSPDTAAHVDGVITLGELSTDSPDETPTAPSNSDRCRMYLTENGKIVFQYLADDGEGGTQVLYHYKDLSSEMSTWEDSTSAPT